MNKNRAVPGIFFLCKYSLDLASSDLLVLRVREFWELVEMERISLSSHTSLLQASGQEAIWHILLGKGSGVGSGVGHQ